MIFFVLRDGIYWILFIYAYFWFFLSVTICPHLHRSVTMDGKNPFAKMEGGFRFFKHEDEVKEPKMAMRFRDLTGSSVKKLQKRKDN